MMLRAHLRLLTVATLLGACAETAEHEPQHADGATQVILPAGSELTYTRKPSDPEAFYFAGDIAVTGMLLAYWEVQYLEAEPVTLAEAEPVRQMYLRFYPDPDSQPRLPAFRSVRGDKIRPQRVFLYRELESGEPLDTLHAAYEEHETNQIEALIGDFASLPPDFLKHREGFALQPTQLRLEDLTSFVEANHRFLYARARAIEPLSITEYGLRQITDADPDTFLGRPWVETFYAPEPLTVHQHPTAQSAEVIRLPADTFGISKVRTIDEHWVLVRIEREEGDTVTGYVRTTDLLVVN